MMHRAFGLACGVWALASVASLAQNTPLVVELYTSQGCSSCPPADDLFAQMTEDPNLIPLALHVDYWDYIGWIDKFAKPQYTQRQKAYAKAAGSRMIYTPQMIVAGESRVEGNDPDSILGAIQKEAAVVSDVSLSVQREGGALRIRVEGTASSTPMRVQLVRYQPEKTVTIEHGENAGKTVTYHNIVTRWERVADWNGGQPLDMSLPIEGDEPAVVLVQRDGPGRILAAARVD